MIDTADLCPEGRRLLTVYELSNIYSVGDEIFAALLDYEKHCQTCKACTLALVEE